MNILKSIASLLVLAPVAAFASQNAPYAVEAETKGGDKLLSLNFETSGDVAAFTFRVVLPEGSKRINTSRCLSELPEGFTGVCKAYGNVVAVTAYSAGAKALPAGLVSVGKLSYQSAAKAAAVIDSFEASTPDAKEAQLGAAKVEKLD